MRPPFEAEIAAIRAVTDSFVQYGRARRDSAGAALYNGGRDCHAPEPASRPRTRGDPLVARGVPVDVGI